MFVESGIKKKIPLTSLVLLVSFIRLKSLLVMTHWGNKVVPETKKNSIRQALPYSALRYGEKIQANKTSIIYHPNMHKSQYMEFSFTFSVWFQNSAPHSTVLKAILFLHCISPFTSCITNTNEPQSHQEFISTRKCHANNL